MGIPYFGGKSRIASRYPPPAHDLLIEPFAGMLGYGWHHRPAKTLAYEADERVAETWARLAALREVPSPPSRGTKTRDLFSMMLTYSEHSLTSEYLTVTSRMLRDWDSVHRRIIAAGEWMRSVDYALGSYEDAPDIEATWFIDPPYQYANRRGYAYGASRINYAALADWCRARRGRVMVCEQKGADWLPFAPLARVASHRGAVSDEVWWWNGVLGSYPGRRAQ